MNTTRRDSTLATNSTTLYGAIVSVFCILNLLAVITPYSELANKGVELPLIPAIFAGITKAFHVRSKCPVPANSKSDVLMMIAISLISIITFNLPNPNMIWLMMVVILFVYIPLFLLLFSRGLIFVWKGSKFKGQSPE